jgi:adenine-specific DNA-methyltransferase
MRWDAPEHYGVGCKRVDCKTTKSAYNSKREAWLSFGRLIERLSTPWIIVSFNNEGYHHPDKVAALLSEKGYIRSVAIDYKRYVGAQIGIFNPSGTKVGAVSHLRNKELLFVVGPDEALVEAAVDRLAPAETSALPETQEALF